MYVAYYILKHKLIGEAMNEYLAKVIKEWKSLETQGWCGYSKMYSGEKYFRERVDSLIDTYSDEENGNQYTPFELNGIVVKELTLEQWNQIIE